MLEAGTLSWPAVATFGAAAGCLYLTRVAWRYTDQPGGRLFLGTAAGMSGIAVLSGVAFLSGDPAVREAIELAVLTVGLATAVSWFAFGVVYTGHGRVLETPLFGAAAALVAGLAVAVVTNPLHGVVWEEFRVVETAGAFGVTFDSGSGLVAIYLVIAVLLVAPTAVLLESYLRFGSPYRRQTIALSVTPIFPGSAMTLYVFDLGPVPELNLVGLALLPHMLLDVYALSVGQLFVFSPSTRQTGERAALDELATPVIVVNEEFRIITINDAAAATFELETDVVGRGINEITDGDHVDPGIEDPGPVSLETAAGWRTFEVAGAPLRNDATGQLVGYTVSLTDVSAARRRKQRLEVLNRVLRHNLRNDLNVVTGYAESIQVETDDQRLATLAGRIQDSSDELIGLAERARTVDGLLDRQPKPETVAVAELLAETATQLRTEDPEAQITVETDRNVQLRTDPALLTVALEAGAGHVLAHAEESAPTLQISTTERDGEVIIRVDSDGQSVPRQERRPVERRTETKLDHAVGIDHWLTVWTVEHLGGTVSFETDEAIVEMRIPDLAPAGSRSEATV